MISSKDNISSAKKNKWSTWMRPALAPAMVIEEMESGWGSCLRTWGEMESRIMFGKSSKSIHLRIHPEGDGVDAGHPQEGRRHAPVQSGHPLFPGNQPLKKFMPGLIFLPHAVQQAVKGSLVGSSWRGLDPNLHCVQRIASQHSSCSWDKNNVVSFFLVELNLTSHTTSQKLKSHCCCLGSDWFVIGYWLVFFKV